MMARVRPALAPAYLFLCLLLGGSSRGVWGNAILQLLAIAIIAWALLERRESLVRPAKQLLAFAIAPVLIILVQLVPLPQGIWTALPGRKFLASGFDLLAIRPGALPLSLSPYDSLAALLGLLPLLGMLAAMLVLRAYSRLWLAIALVAGAIAGVLLGILQVGSPSPGLSPWYLYDISNFGVATGFFANSNHMATLLLVTIPFIAALGATLRGRTRDVGKRTAGLAVAASGLALVILGLILNRSLAGYGLGLPVLLASLPILLGPPARWARGLAAAIGLAGIGAIALLWTSPIPNRFDNLGASTSVTSRGEIASNSLALAGQYWPAGSGVGTYPMVYQLREDPARVEPYYVNHAHNDYLELAVETGLPGVLLVLLFLLWLGKRVIGMLRSSASDQYARAGAVAAAAILIHGMVDFPLRTAAIGAVFAMSLALIILSRRSSQGAKDLRPARHLVVG